VRESSLNQCSAIKLSLLFLSPKPVMMVEIRRSSKTHDQGYTAQHSHMAFQSR
jgi:hypothetical protein